MSYLDTLKSEAETRLKNLSAKVATLTRQLAELKKRAADEDEAHVKAVDDLARLKAVAGEYLADGSGTFDRYKTRLKAALLRVETSAESAGIFARELIPGKERELAEARKKLTDEFSILYATAKPACETRMADLMTQVVAERDAFVAAFAEIGRTYGGSYNGGAPVAYHVRLDEIKHTLTGRRWLVFRPAPPPPAAPATPAPCPAAAVLDVLEAAESTPTPSIRESGTGDGPRGETLAPEAIDAAAECPTGAAAPLGTDANRARVLRCHPPATETPLAPAEDSPAPTENPPEAAPDTPGPDPLPLDVDAEVDAELDAETPPESVEKENPGNAAEAETHPHGVAPV